MQTIPWWRRFDPLLVLLPMLLVLYGLALIHSATCQPDCARWLPPSSETVRQAIFAVAGFAAMGIFALIDYRLSRMLAYVGYAGSIALLVLVLVPGVGHDGEDASYGALRWISMGPFNIQVSEVAKLGLILALARWLSGAGSSLGWRRLGASFVFLVPAVYLVYLEPDLGTTLSLVAIWFAMVCGAGLRVSQFAVLAAGALAAIPLGWFVLRQYMRERIFTFINVVMDPNYDPFGEGYNKIGRAHV